MIIVPEIKDPVIRYNGESYTLTNAITDYNIDEPVGRVVRSCLNGTANVIHKGKLFTGSITVYNINTTTLNTYKAMERQTVRLWPVGQGGIDGTNPPKYYPYVDVIIVNMTPFHHENKLFMDAVIISFESKSYYTLRQAFDNGISTPS